MKRRHWMKLAGGIGAASLFGSASARNHNDNGNGPPDHANDGGNGRSGQYTPYGGNDTKTAEGLGTFDDVLMYLAEGHNDFSAFDTMTGPRSDDTQFNVDGDPLSAKYWQLDIQKRTVEEVIADRQAHHDYTLEHYGIDLQGEYFGQARTVPPGTFTPPLGQRGPKAKWAFPGVGPDRFTGEPVPEEGITEDNVFHSFVWRPDPYGQFSEAVFPEISLFLRPEVGYTNYLRSGASVPANAEPDNPAPVGATTNRSSSVTNKVRDGGYWIFAVEDDSVSREFLAEHMEAAGLDRPAFWYNVQADGKLRTGRGVSGGREPEIDPPDKLFLDGVGPDRAWHDGLPEEMGTFWGHYNINRGENRAPISIHYRSGFPTEFNPHSGIPRAFMCELQSAEMESSRNPKGLGRVHGSTYGTSTSVNENTSGHLFRKHGRPDGAPTRTIRNILTFPPSLTRGRNQDGLDNVAAAHVAPGWPDIMPDSQFDIPGYPEALKEELEDDPHAGISENGIDL